MKYSALLTLCLLASIIRPIIFYNFVKCIIHEKSPYQSGVLLSIDGLLFMLLLVEVFSRL